MKSHQVAERKTNGNRLHSTLLPTIFYFLPKPFTIFSMLIFMAKVTNDIAFERLKSHCCVTLGGYISLQLSFTEMSSARFSAKTHCHMTGYSTH